MEEELDDGEEALLAEGTCGIKTVLWLVVALTLATLPDTDEVLLLLLLLEVGGGGGGTTALEDDEDDGVVGSDGGGRGAEAAVGVELESPPLSASSLFVDGFPSLALAALSRGLGTLSSAGGALGSPPPALLLSDS